MTAEPPGSPSGSRSSPSSETPSSVENRTNSTSCDDDSVGDGRQPSGLGFALRDPLPWGDLAAIVRTGEHLGYSALFLPEITGRDSLVALGALAGETSELLLGTGIVPIRSRATMLTAMA